MNERVSERTAHDDEPPQNQGGTANEQDQVDDEDDFADRDQSVEFVGCVEDGVGERARAHRGREPCPCEMVESLSDRMSLASLCCVQFLFIWCCAPCRTHLRRFTACLRSIERLFFGWRCVVFWGAYPMLLNNHP